MRLKRSLTDEQRFWVYTQVGPDCWRWTGYFVGEYGRMRWRRRMTLAHHVSWMIHNGALPDGVVLLHKCAGGGNAWCVNPAHLAVRERTPGLVENADDMMQAGRHWSTTGVWRPQPGEQSPNTAMTDQMVIDARRRVRRGEWCEVIAGEYGVAVTTLRNAVAGRTWRYLSEPPVKSTLGGARTPHRRNATEHQPTPPRTVPSDPTSPA